MSERVMSLVMLTDPSWDDRMVLAMEATPAFLRRLLRVTAGPVPSMPEMPDAWTPHAATVETEQRAVLYQPAYPDGLEADASKSLTLLAALCDGENSDWLGPFDPDESDLADYTEGEVGVRVTRMNHGTFLETDRFTTMSSLGVGRADVAAALLYHTPDADLEETLRFCARHAPDAAARALLAPLTPADEGGEPRGDLARDLRACLGPAQVRAVATDLLGVAPEALRPQLFALTGRRAPRR